MHDRPSHPAEVTAARSAAARAAARSAQAATTARAAAATAPGTGGTSFASLLSDASDTPTVSTGASTTPAGGTTTTDATAALPEIHLRTGETTSTVASRQYAEIHGGKRDGMFVNTSANKRRGEAFTIVTRHGRELHVYGSGNDRLVVRVSPPRDPANPPAPIQLHEGETMTPVPGHHYAQIHGGERDGMFVNTSLNSRRGQAFVTVTKDGVDYHVYGAGKDRQVIRCVPHDPGPIVTSS
jgi:hypothetical protein